MDHLEEIVWEASIAKGSYHSFRNEGRLRRRFEDHTVSRQQCRYECADEYQVRKLNKRHYQSEVQCDSVKKDREHLHSKQRQ